MKNTIARIILFLRRMDEADESTPALLIRDAPAVFIDGGGYPADAGGRSACILCVL